MVYCGKPSKGCSNCRARKIRCDLRESGCFQCERLEQECSGYRNIVDLMFRDESSHVIQRAKSAKPRRKPASAPRSAASTPTIPSQKQSGSNSSKAGTPGYGSSSTLVTDHRNARPSSSSSSPSSPVSSLPFSSSSSSPRRKKMLAAKGDEGSLSVLIPTAPPPYPPPRRARSDDCYSPSYDGKARGREDRQSDSDDDDDDDDDDNDDDDDGEAASASAGTNDSDGDLPSPDEGTWPATPTAALLYALAPPLQERGLALFFARYVTNEMSPVHQKYDFLIDIWKPASARTGRQVDSVLASMTAVGLAALAGITGHPATMDLARRSYGAALCLTNEVVRDPDTALLDTTMLSVLVLGTYEMLTGRTAAAIAAWQEHMNGAIGLAASRGSSQLRKRAGVRLFYMLFRCVHIRCVQLRTAMPRPLIDLHNELGRVRPPCDDPMWHTHETMCKVLQARQDIRNGVLTDATLTVRTLGKLDDEFAAIVSNLGPSWQYHIVGAPPADPAVFGHRCRVYASREHASMWNHIRSCRLSILETILEQLHGLAHNDGSDNDDDDDDNDDINNNNNNNNGSSGSSSSSGGGGGGMHNTAEMNSLTDTYRAEMVRTMVLMLRLRDAILESIPQHFGAVSIRDAAAASASDAASHLRLDRRHQVQTSLSAAVPSYQLVSSPVTTTCSSSVSSPADGHAVFPTIGPSSAPTSQASEEEARRFMVVGSAASVLIWPLWLVGTSSSCTPAIRQYVVGRLRAIHDKTGMAEAGEVAAMVEEASSTRLWETLSSPATAAAFDADDASAVVL